LLIKTKILSCHKADSKPVKQEVNSTVILPPLVFPGVNIQSDYSYRVPHVIVVKTGDGRLSVGLLSFAPKILQI